MPGKNLPPNFGGTFVLSTAFLAARECQTPTLTPQKLIRRVLENIETRREFFP
jgi:hypothetical protein